ncbi:hypothetical protein V8E54_006174 [Elaphomyces granulatus]
MAAARQEQAGIQGRHRLERRQGDDPSQTPPFTSLVARHEVSQSTEEPHHSFLLILPSLISLGPRRGRGCPSLPDDPIDPVQPRRGRGRPSLPDDPIDPAQPRPGRPRLPDAPPSDRVAAGDAMSAAHWARVEIFRRALYGEIKECCSQCHEEWVNMQLNRDNVCHRCLLKDKDKEPPLLSDDNEMGPRIYPEGEKAPSPNPDSKTANGLSLDVLQRKTEGPEVSMGPTKKKWLEALSKVLLSIPHTQTTDERNEATVHDRNFVEGSVVYTLLMTFCMANAFLLLPSHGYCQHSYGEKSRSVLFSTVSSQGQWLFMVATML